VGDPGLRQFFNLTRPESIRSRFFLYLPPMRFADGEGNFAGIAVSQREKLSASALRTILVVFNFRGLPGQGNSRRTAAPVEGKSRGDQ
jgi:hypothetical protein